ncbi:hypothetical protein A2U01_0031229, partial [Trifolium medium]|nr:hypothetical protein [Trifolium medium]
LYQSYERFKLLKRRCPNHRICGAELMYIFINGMKQKQRMFLDASAGGTVQNKTPTEVEELIQNMCQNQYNKIEDDEEILVEQLEGKARKEQLEQINKLHKEEDLRKVKQSEEQKIRAARLEIMMIQLTKVIGEHMQSTKAEIQHLAKEVSNINEEQSKAIELRNRKVDIVEKPRKDRAGTHPTKETHDIENVVEEELDEMIEHTTEKEPTVHDSPRSASIPPPAYTTEKSPAIVAPYPVKYGKKEIIKEQNRKFEGYLTQMEINV